MKNELRPIIKSTAGTLWAGTGIVRRRECWEATTVDGEWAFERIEEPGTPWIVVHHPRTPQAETVNASFGTLKSARQAVERGNLEQWLPSVQATAHARGEHTTDNGICRACRDEWFARRAAR